MADTKKESAVDKADKALKSGADALDRFFRSIAGVESKSKGKDSA